MPFDFMKSVLKTKKYFFLEDLGFYVLGRFIAQSWASFRFLKFKKIHHWKTLDEQLVYTSDWLNEWSTTEPLARLENWNVMKAFQNKQQPILFIFFQCHTQTHICMWLHDKIIILNENKTKIKKTLIWTINRRH